MYCEFEFIYIFGERPPHTHKIPTLSLLEFGQNRFNSIISLGFNNGSIRVELSLIKLKQVRARFETIALTLLKGFSYGHP